jgi:hypothetical protein
MAATLLIPVWPIERRLCRPSSEATVRGHAPRRSPARCPTPSPVSSARLPATPRRVPFFVRLFGFTELRDWLVQAGFAAVDGYDRDGTPLSAASRRLLVVAQR